MELQQLHPMLLLSGALPERGHSNQGKVDKKDARNEINAGIYWRYMEQKLSESGRTLREAYRKKWFTDSLRELENCDIIFCDLDNGIETKSLSKTSKDSVKYVYINEIEQMVNMGYYC